MFHHFSSSLTQTVMKYRWLLLLIGAALMGLVVIFPQVGILQWVVLIPALLVILTCLSAPNITYRQMYGWGFCFYWVYFTICFHWFLWMYPLDYAGMSNAASAVVVCLGSVGLAAFQAVTAALVFPLFGWLVRGKYLSERHFWHPFLFAILWVLVEWFQAHSGWSGVPWGRLCLGQADVLVTMQSASLFGSYFVSFLILLVNGLLTLMILRPNRKWLCGGLAMGLLLGNVAFGWVYMHLPKEESPTVKVAAIQGNMASGEEWGAFGALERAMDIYTKLTKEAAQEGAQIVLWPETAIPANIDIHLSIGEDIKALAKECQITILAGVFTLTEDREGEYNAVIAAKPDGTWDEVVYGKRNLVPFGEFVPLRDLVTTLVPPLTEINTLGSDLAFGESAKVIPFGSYGVSPLICFDSIYENNALESVQAGANLLAVPTNDSWFKDSRGVWMHSAQGQLRAIETGRYVLRAANTGVSSVITDKGEVLDKLDPFVTGYVLQEAELLSHTTLYSAIGNLFVYLCMAFLAGCAGINLVSAVQDRRRRKLDLVD